MTKIEITRALRRYRYDPDMALQTEGRARNAARRKNRPNPRLGVAGESGHRVVPMVCLAALARLNQRQVHYAQRGIMTESVRAALAHVIVQIESGLVRFVRARGPAKGQPRWSVEYCNPPARRPPPQDKLTRAADWREWGRCRNCGGQVWRSVVIAGAFWYACRDCVGRDSLPAMGARETTPAEKSVLPESLMRESV